MKVVFDQYISTLASDFQLEREATARPQWFFMDVGDAT
jgi:hypothetical protein